MIGLGLGFDNGSAGGFSPTSIAGTTLWLRADRGVSGSPVSTWADQSGAGNNAAATGTGRPTASSGGGPNGKARVIFASGQWLHIPSALGITTGAWSMYIAFLMGSGRPIFQVGDAATNGVGVFLSGSPNRSIYVPGVDIATDGVYVNTPEVWGVRHTTAPNTKMAVNGSNQSLSSTTLVQVAPSAGTDLFSWGNGVTEFGAGEMYEAIVWNRALTDTEDAAVTAYLLTRYALS